MVMLALANPGWAGPSLKARWPVDDNACVDSPLRLTFDEAPVITGSGGKIEVSRADNGQVVATVVPGAGREGETLGSIGGPVLSREPVTTEGNTVTVRLRSRTLEYGQTYVVRLGAGIFKDMAAMEGEWKFTTKPALPRNPDRLTVAADGSGDFCTVQGAIDHIDPHRVKAATIFIRKGIYQDLVRVGREKRFIHLAGEDRKETVITSTNNDKLNPGWIHRSVLGVEGDDFSLENLTVRNTTPYKGSQAEAICLNAERCTLKNADFISTQDTLHLSGSVRVADCYIEGDVDYVWGYGSAFFERCELKSTHDGYIVQARNPPGKAGYVFVDCKFTAAKETKRSWLARIETGRFPASHVTFIRCEMGPHIPEAGWLVTGPDSSALRFEEHGSKDAAGNPIDTSKRLAQSKQITIEEADRQVESGKVLSPLPKKND